jgi:hypothetical protein
MEAGISSSCFFDWGSLQRLEESARCPFFHVDLKGAPYTNLNATVNLRKNSKIPFPPGI